MLAGLLSNIGELAVLQYAVNYPSLFEDEVRMHRWCEALSGILGKQLLEKWHFPQELAEVAGSAHQWLRNPHVHADLSDLILLAMDQCIDDFRRIDFVQIMLNEMLVLSCCGDNQ